MTRVVEISAEAVAGVRGDVASVQGAVESDWTLLRARARNLGVSTAGFDDVLGVSDRLSTHVLPVIDVHLGRARALEDLRYGGAMGRCLPVLDVDPAPVAVPFIRSPFDDGGTTLTWAVTSPGAVEADEQDTEQSQGIGGWFSERWDDVSGAVSDGADWVADTAGQAWERVTEAGAAFGDWWETTTADLGGWIDANPAGVREFIGRHVAVFRFLADALRIVGWVLVAVGAVLAIALAIIGAMGGAAIGAVFGFGVGAVPGGAAGAAAGLAFGLKILGVGFALVSVGDFLDVAANWGEGTIDGQDLVQLGTLELGLAATSLLGVGVIGKILQKAVKHLPASWRRRIDDFLVPVTGRGPRSDADMRAPLHNDAASGPGWHRSPDVEPDVLYGQARVDRAPLAPGNGVPSTIDPDIRALGPDLSNPWGTDPMTGRPFTQGEWEARFSTGTGDVRWPPNRGAVPGTRLEFTDAERFIETYGDRFDRIGDDSGGFLGVPPGTRFGQRSLPPDTLDDGLHAYTFTGMLPPDITIEVSEIAPAFGQPGGGLQSRFMQNGRAVPVWKLFDLGVLI